MKKPSLISLCIISIIFLVLCSWTNVVGYQMIQTSYKEKEKNETTQKELLLQTILDIANNKEIKKIILKSEIKRGIDGLFITRSKSSFFILPRLTKNFLNCAYNLGVILYRSLDVSKIRSMFERYQLHNQGIQKEITAVIEKNTELRGKIVQLLDLTCDCENDDMTKWIFPVICTLLLPLFMFSFYLYFGADIAFLINIIYPIGKSLNCYWAW